MRADMYKLITECYRLNRGTSYRKQRSRLNQQLREAIAHDDETKLDLLPKKESINGWTNWSDEKEFGENLAPLRRFLLSCIGRQWDEVHSEMAAHIDCKNEAQRHVWLHVEQYVEEKTFISENGNVCFRSEFMSSVYRQKEPQIEDSYALVYVCPKSGILKKVPHKNRFRFKKKLYSGRIEIDQWHQGHKIGHYWYVIEIAKIPDPYWLAYTEKQKQGYNKEIDKYNKFEKLLSKNAYRYYRGLQGRWVYPEYVDVATEDIIKTHCMQKGFADRSIPSFHIYGIRNVYAKNKKQMNTKELKKYGLKS